MLPDFLGFYALAKERRNFWITRWHFHRYQSAVLKITQARAETKAQHRAKRKYMIGRAAGVGKMLADIENAAMMQQAVKHRGRLMRCSGNHFNMIQPALVRHMGIKAEARIIARASIDVAAARASLCPAKKLAVRA